jgi:hypothetical protein
MKYTADRPFADLDKAARKLIEIANSAEAVQDGRIQRARGFGSNRGGLSLRYERICEPEYFALCEL